MLKSHRFLLMLRGTDVDHCLLAWTKVDMRLSYTGMCPVRQSRNGAFWRAENCAMSTSQGRLRIAFVWPCLWGIFEAVETHGHRHVIPHSAQRHRANGHTYIQYITACILYIHACIQRHGEKHTCKMDKPNQNKRSQKHQKTSRVNRVF